MELVLSLASPSEMAGTDLRPYDAVCLGSPYCRLLAGNFAEDLSAMGTAVAALHDAGKRAYVTTPAAPRGADLAHVARLIDAAASVGADAIEVHNAGVLRMVKNAKNPLPVHMGAYANVCTGQAAAVLAEYGAARVRPNAEVALSEAPAIREMSGVALEWLLFGKIPLGVTDKCFLLEGREGVDPACPDACVRGRWLSAKAWLLKSVGKGILSGKDQCLVEHLPALLAAGVTAFRVDGLYESAEFRSEAGRVCREALDEAVSAGSGAFEVRAEWVSTLRRLSPNGVCDGYLSGEAGHRCIGAAFGGELK